MPETRIAAPDRTGGEQASGMTDRVRVEPPQRVPVSKRMLDLSGSVAGLVLLAPVYAVFATLIRLDSPGPVLFRQVRLGRGGRPFTMYKFRTMTDGNSSEAHERYVSRMIQGDEEELRNSEGAFKLEDDPRITRFGRWLRTMSLDELPQLVNVARGEMSLVGPRPPLPYEAGLYTPRHALRLRVLPGMTGLWQVSGRNGTTFEEMVELDIAYIENRSLLLDLSILLRTVREVASGKGS